jgi:hypothetical protein
MRQHGFPDARGLAFWHFGGREVDRDLPRGGEITSNTVEGYYSIFRRGMKGVYQHCSEKHLHRYLAEFDFRYSNRIWVGVDDQDRADKAIRGMVGKRLTYRQSPDHVEAT